jgi:hypothetical protein
MTKRTSKASIVLLLLFLGGVMTACQSDSSQSAIATSGPAIDFDAVYVENEVPGDYVQVLLKMSLMNQQGDILKYGLSMPEQHQQRLQYYMQDFKNNIQLISGRDTIPCLDSHFERLNMDLPYRNFILTFQRPFIQASDQLLIGDPIFTQQIIQTSIRKSND